jgi:hypothetical protein
MMMMQQALEQGAAPTPAGAEVGLPLPYRSQEVRPPSAEAPHAPPRPSPALQAHHSSPAREWRSRTSPAPPAVSSPKPSPPRPRPSKGAPRSARACITAPTASG